MMNAKLWKYIFILAVILGCVYLLIPSFQFYSKPAEVRANPEVRDKYIDSAIKLGLDLQGGMHLVLEIDDAKLSADAKRDAMDRVLTIIRNRVDQFGVAEPVIQKQGDRRLIVQLPGLQDPERARGLIGRTAQLDFRLVRDSNELLETVDALDKALKGVKVTGTGVDSTEAMNAPPETMAEAETNTAVDTAAATAPEQTASPFDTLLPEVPGESEPLEVPFSADEDAPFVT